MRSRRSIVTFGAAALGCAFVFGVLAFGAFRVPAGWIAGVALGAGALGACGVVGWTGLRLRAWPSAKLACFRDRLVVIHGRQEMRALWGVMDTVTLADLTAWPHVRMTDHVTIGIRNEPPIRFRPASFGLEASACRDMLIKLRDEAGLRERLPEFDSLRDLAASPSVAGELYEPRF